MSDIQNYLSLLSALTSSNSVQSLYSDSYDSQYSALSSLYGSDNDESSFSSIFGTCVSALQNSNNSLLTNLLSSLSDDTTNDESEASLLTSLEEASKDTCDCTSADLVKKLYAEYLSSTSGSYIKNQLTTDADSTASTAASDTTASTSSTAATSTTAVDTDIESSIPTEEEIDSMIAATISLPA